MKKPVMILVLIVSLLGAQSAFAQDNGEDPTATPACKDGANHILGWRVGSAGYSYYYNGYAAPTNVAAAVPKYLKAATIHASQSFNSCGLTPTYGPTPHYLGATSRFPQVSAINQPPSYRCLANGDGYNETAWLANHQPDAFLAVTCTWWDTSTDTVIESDMEFNRVTKWFAATPPAVCVDAYDLYGVATHERGHTYGLNHPDYRATDDHHVHANLTMNSETAPCTTREETFGAGDVYAMARRY